MQAVGSTLVVVMLVSGRAESAAMLVVPWRCVPVLPQWCDSRSGVASGATASTAADTVIVVSDGLRANLFQRACRPTTCTPSATASALASLIPEKYWFPLWDSEDSSQF